MNFYRRFPYTNLNDINLDWIIKKVKALIGLVDEKQDKPASTGEAGQVLGLDENLNPVWLDQTGGGGTSNYNSLINKPQIESITLSGNKTAADLGLALASDVPTKTSDLTNDSGFINAAAAPVQSVNGMTGNVSIIVPSASSILPKMDGIASAGSNFSKFARADHVHPTDMSRASAAVEDAIAYVQSGDTASRTYTAGQFVYLKNHPTLAEGMYTVNSGGIPQNTSVTGHLTASGNGFNLLTSEINKKIDYGKMIINSDGTGITQTYSIGNRGLGFPIFMLSIGFASKSMVAIILLNSSTENAIASFKIGGTGTLDISSITYDPSTQIISITFSSEPYRSGRLTSLNW